MKSDQLDRAVARRGSWLPWLRILTAVMFGCLFGLPQLLHAQLYVTSFNDSSIAIYGMEPVGLLPSNFPAAVPGTSPATSWQRANVGSTGGAEGAVCLMNGGIPSLLVGNAGAGNIYTFEVGGTTLNPTLPPFGMFSITGGSSLTNLSLSPSGSSPSVLYVADYAGKIWPVINPAQYLSFPYNYPRSPSNLPISPTGVPVSPSVHDLAVDKSGNVYSADFTDHFGGVGQSTPSGVTPFLSPPTQFIPPATATSDGLRSAAGMVFDKSGNLWVSNFSPLNGTCAPNTPLSSMPLDCPSIDMYTNGKLVYQVLAASNATGPYAAVVNSGPLGLALGPDGNIYVAMFNLNSIGQITIANLPLAAGPTIVIQLGAGLGGKAVFNPTYMQNCAGCPPVFGAPKYLGFIQNCSIPDDAFVEVCKASSPTNPVTGTADFTVASAGANGSAGQSVSIRVPVGGCSGAIPVPAGNVTITETQKTGVGLSAVAATGYSTSSGVLENRLSTPSPNLAAGTATVTAVAGDVSFETVATFTNQSTVMPEEGPVGQLKICKIAGDNVSFGTTFNITATSTTGISQTYAVQAGPPSEGGYCYIDYSTFPIGTQVTVAEGGTSEYTVTSAVSPAGTTGGSAIKATLEGGFTEVTFTNSCSSIVACETISLFEWDANGLSFSGTIALTPTPQPITVTSTPPVPFTAAASITSGPPGWLTVGPTTSAVTPATLLVSVAALPAGIYSGAITITSTDATNPGSSTIPVTFTVAAVSPLTSIGSMAQLAFAGSWTTTFTLANTGTTPVQASLNFFDNNGNPLPVPLVFPQSGTTAGSPVATTTFTVNPGAGQLIQTAGLASQPTQVGWTQLAATGDLGGFAVFQQAIGQSIQEAVVPLENLNPAGFVIWYDNTGGQSTGIALANTSAQAASIPVVIRDDTGAILQSTTIQLAADGHTSFDLASTYAMTSGIRGTVEFETPAGGQISVLGIAFSPAGAFTTIPALVAASGSSTSSGSMAQLAFAGGWTTTFTLVNTGTTPAQASLNFFDNNGNPLPVPLVFPQSSTTAGSPVATTTVTVNPGAGQLIQTAGLASQPTQVGWTQLAATGDLGGFAVFQQAIGQRIQEAVVPLENLNPTGFVIWYDNTGGQATGIALANTSAQAASIPVVIRDDTGAILQSTTIQLAADGHTSFDLASTYAMTAGIRGTVEFDTTAGGQISVLGIEFSPAGAFTTIPALTK